MTEFGWQLVFLLGGDWGEGQAGGSPEQLMKQEEISVSAALTLAPGTPAPPACLCYMVARARRSLLAPPDTVPSLGYHTSTLVQGSGRG